MAYTRPPRAVARPLAATWWRDFGRASGELPRSEGGGRWPRVATNEGGGGHGLARAVNRPATCAALQTGRRDVISIPAGGHRPRPGDLGRAAWPVPPAARKAWS